jgi:hypothetical protein
MDGEKVAGQKGAPAGSDVQIDRGIERLLQAGEEKPKQKTRLPAWYFFAADFFLLLLALVIVNTSRPLGPLQYTFAAICIVLGGALSIFGACRQPN